MTNPIPLVITGPIELSYKKARKGSSKIIENEHVNLFRKKVNRLKIGRKHGCYIFALRASKGYVPWYVGKSSSGLVKECSTDGKIKKYNSVMFDGYKGTPVMFFIVPGGNKNVIPKKELSDLENFLIQSAYYKNNEITNICNTKNLPRWGIAGVIRGGRGKHSGKAKYFSKMMGL